MADVRIYYEVVVDERLTTVCGECIRLPYTNASFGIHARHSALGEFQGWTITHLLSGACFGEGGTKTAAFLNAVQHVRKHGSDMPSVLARAVEFRAQLESALVAAQGG